MYHIYDIHGSQTVSTVTPPPPYTGAALTLDSPGQDRLVSLWIADDNLGALFVPEFT
jgi:hypothetical protein